MKKSLLVILAALLLLLCSCSDSSEEPEETTISPEELALIDEWQARAEPFTDMFEYVTYPDHVEIETFIDPATENRTEYINTHGKYAVKELVVPAYIEGLPVTVIRERAFGEYYRGSTRRSRGEYLSKVV